MIVCLCHRVCERDIAREVAQGCERFDDLQDRTRVATGCGACLEFAQQTFTAHLGGGSCGDPRGCPAGQVSAAGHAAPLALPAPAAPLRSFAAVG